MNQLPTNRTQRDWMSDIFGGLFPAVESEQRFRPASEVAETPESYSIKLDLPGVRDEDLHITFENDTLSIRGERKSEDRKENEKVHIVERRHGSFLRSFSFPSSVQSDLVKAELKDGVLSIQVPKAKESVARRIEVSRS
jgi:HSP20 family protein